MFNDWLIHTDIEVFIVCLSLQLFCLIYNVYVTCTFFANLLFMFITSGLIVNYMYSLESFVILKNTRIYVFKKASYGSTYGVLNLRKFSIIRRGQFKYTQFLTCMLQRILPLSKSNLIRSGRNSNNFWTQGRTYIFGNGVNFLCWD